MAVVPSWCRKNNPTNALRRLDRQVCDTPITVEEFYNVRSNQGYAWSTEQLNVIWNGLPREDPEDDRWHSVVSDLDSAMDRLHASLGSFSGSIPPATVDSTEPGQPSGAVPQQTAEASTFTVSVPDPTTGFTRVFSTSMNVAA